MGKLIIVIGRKMAKTFGIDLKPEVDLGDEGAVIRDVKRKGSYNVVVAGSTPRGTNFGIVTLLRLVHAEGRVPYLEAPLNLRSKPKMAVHGIHLNGGTLKYPYGFRTWGDTGKRSSISPGYTAQISSFCGYSWRSSPFRCL
jgi:alpha-glucuronidase